MCYIIHWMEQGIENYCGLLYYCFEWNKVCKNIANPFEVPVRLSVVHTEYQSYTGAWFFIVASGNGRKTIAFSMTPKGPKTAECRITLKTWPMGRNIECRSDPFVIPRFPAVGGIQYSIFNIRRSLLAGESNSFDEAMSARQAIGFSR